MELSNKETVIYFVGWNKVTGDFHNATLAVTNILKAEEDFKKEYPRYIPIHATLEPMETFRSCREAIKH